MIHETAIVDDCTIGEGTKIWAFSHISSGAVIGNNCVIAKLIMTVMTVSLALNDIINVHMWHCIISYVPGQWPGSNVMRGTALQCCSF